ncbi:MAG: hypothetical protein IJC06_04595 [Clostridia bacterium]|nr:hypothetical protein [Clostridia bacterium]
MKTKLKTMIIAVAFVIIASTTGVLAADILYSNTTYTEINNGKDLQITVSYTASDYHEGEQVTLMVLLGSDRVLYDQLQPETPTNIAYIDQTEITGSEGSFTFNLAKSFVEENKIYIKLGSNTMLTAKNAIASIITVDAVALNDIKGVVGEYISGYDGNYAQKGTDVKFTVNRGVFPSNIRCRVYDSANEVWGEYVSLTPDANDVITIDGEKITDNIEIDADVFREGVYVQLVTRDQYKAFVKETQNKQICAIFGTSPSDTYTVKGKEAFWSSKYNAHVVWISSSETLSTLFGNIEVTEGVAATAIDYNGDLNGNGRTTAADATFVKDCLFNSRLVSTSEMQLFKLDVEEEDADGFMMITTADIVKVLKMAVGK